MRNRKIKVLMVDDNNDNLINMRAMIKEIFPESAVFVANNGQIGFALATAEDPDVIFLDIVMTKINGFELCRRLKADSVLSEIPVVFITAIKADKGTRIHALDCGAEAFISKPLDESELTAQIRAMVKIKDANIRKRFEKEQLIRLVEEKTQDIKNEHKKVLELLEDLKKENEVRKESQSALTKSEAKYRRLAENMTDVVWTSYLNLKTIYITPSVEKLLGESVQAHMDRPLEEKFTPNSLRIINEVLSEELEKEKDPKGDKNRTRIIEVELYRADGNAIWVSMHISFIRDESGLAIGIQGVSRDITERKLIEEQLKQNLKDLLESQRIAHIGTWRLNLATNQVVWSEELYKMYGFDSTLPPPPYTEQKKLFTSESWDRLSTFLAYTRTSGAPYELELQTVKKDGSNRWLWVRGEVEKDSEGSIVAIWGIAQDITEHKKIE